MPVHCAQKNDVWRIVDSSGNIEKTIKGNPVDGGGHDSKEACQKQAAAINRNLSNVYDELAVWTQKYINDLPDSAFLYIESGGNKDGDGKTVPRSLRHFPYKDANGKIDLPHLRNAIARIPQSNLPQNVKDRVQAKARRMLEQQKQGSSLPFYGIGVEGDLPFAVSSVKEKDGEDPIQHFKKDALPIGVYTHPLFGWKLDVTEERLNHFLSAFKMMRQNGVDVEVPLDHSRSAADNLGYAVDAMIETNPENDNKKTLSFILEIRGHDAIDIVKRNKNVSVAIDREYKDGKGNAYGEAIVHVSIVQQPVVPGQSDFESVDKAAARGSAEKIPVFTLSSLSKETEQMDEKTLGQLKELLGAGDDLTADNAVQRLKERFEQQDEKIANLSQEVVDLKAEKESTGGTKQKAASIDPNLAEQIADTQEKRFAELVKTGKITPVVKDKLCAILIGTKGERKIAMLSLRGEKAEQPSVADEIYTALKENDPVKLGEMTKRQVVDLSRSSPDDSDEVKPDEKSKEAMLMGAGIDPQKQKTT